MIRLKIGFNFNDYSGISSITKIEEYLKSRFLMYNLIIKIKTFRSEAREMILSINKGNDNNLYHNNYNKNHSHNN